VVENRSILPSAVDVYRSETQKVVAAFLRHHLSFPNCISALARLIPTLDQGRYPEQMIALRALMLANTETVMKEMEHRGATGNR
jgi:hypothetical protein